MERIRKWIINLPPAKSLPQHSDPIFEDTSDVKMEHFFVCDDAFPFGMHLMKPYSRCEMADQQRVFNYWLSRARRVSENAFGFMAARFRIMYSMICLHPKNAKFVALTCCTLHNMLMSKSGATMPAKSTWNTLAFLGISNSFPFQATVIRLLNPSPFKQC